jgi:hypothetical protein
MQTQQNLLDSSAALGRALHDLYSREKRALKGRHVGVTRAGFAANHHDRPEAQQGDDCTQSAWLHGRPPPHAWAGGGSGSAACVCLKRWQGVALAVFAAISLCLGVCCTGECCGVSAPMEKACMCRCVWDWTAPCSNMAESVAGRCSRCRYSSSSSEEVCSASACP